MKKIFIFGASILLLGLSVSYGFEDDKNMMSDIQTKDIFKAPLIATPMKVPHVIVQTNGDIKIKEVALYQLVHFDAGSSHDPDGDNLNFSYQWTETNSHKISNKKSFVRKYDKKGLYETTLMVKDEKNLTTIERVCVLVGMDKSNIPLVARVGENQKLNANEKVSLKGSAVCRDDISKYEWRQADKLLSTKANFTTTFKTGQHTLTLTIEDFEGNKAMKSVVINIS